MTLIITLATRNRVIQVSDRRITYRHGGNVFIRQHLNNLGDYGDEDTVKTVYAKCFDAHFAVSFTGLAEINGRPTADFLAAELAGVCDGPMESVFEHFEERIVPDFQRSSILTAFVLSGYSYWKTDNDPHVKNTLFVWSCYTTEPRSLQGGRPHDIFWSIDGSIPKDSQDSLFSELQKELNAICAIRGKGQIDRRSVGSAVEMLVRAIRRAANHCEVGSGIGQNCTSIVLFPNARWVFTGHHKPREITQGYSPPMVLGKTILKALMVAKQGTVLPNGTGMFRFGFHENNQVTMDQVTRW